MYRRYISSGLASLSRTGDFDDYKDKLIKASRRSQNVEGTAAGLFPRKGTSQSDSESSFDSERGLSTRHEPRSFLLDRLMGYFFELLATCDSPVPFPTVRSPSTNVRLTPIASRVSGDVQVKLTPITGRVSRAKKGVPTHTCHICKPPKTFTLLEHLRRHQLSHQTPEFPCTYPGCERAFHRADLLARHTTRHEAEGDKASSRSGTGDNSRRASTTSTSYDEGPQGQIQPKPVTSPSETYGSSYSTYGDNQYISPSQQQMSPQQRRDSDGPSSHYIYSTSSIATIYQQPPSLDDSLPGDRNNMGGILGVDARSYDKSLVREGGSSSKDQDEVEEDVDILSQGVEIPNGNVRLRGLSYNSYDTPISNTYDIPRTVPANTPLVITSELGPTPTQERAEPDLSSNSKPSYPFTPIDNSHWAGYNSSAPPPTTSEGQSSYDYIPPTEGIYSSDMITSEPAFFQDPFYTGMIDPPISLYPENSQNALDHSVLASRKRNLQEDGDHNNQVVDEAQSGKRTRVDGSKKATSRKLACPYFKKDPNYGQLARSCSGPGWDTAHRLKEHLDRNHALPPSCDRCFTAFKTDIDRSAHLRSEIQCQLRERPSRMQGFDASQRGQLKGHPKGYKQMSEIHKWCHIYAILFPETEKANIPSPFYNYGSFQDPGHPVDLIVEYDRFLRSKMPERVRDQLERRIKDTLNPVEETLRGQIVEIVCEVQHELSEQFKSSISTTMQDSYSDPKAIDTGEARLEPRVDDDEDNDHRGPVSRAANGVQNFPGLERPSLDNVPEVYLPELFLDTSVRDIDFQLFDFSSLVDGPST